MGPLRISSVAIAATLTASSLASINSPALAQEPPPPEAKGSLDFTASLNDLVSRSPADTCLMVNVDGETVYAHQPTRPLIPASNQKLLTSVGLLDLVGADTRYSTEVRTTDPDLTDGVVNGDLYVVGGGDPSISANWWAARFSHQPQVYTPVESIADAIAATGITGITGRVVGDESRYDGQRYVASWKPNYITDNEAGPLSALATNDGFESSQAGTFRSADPARHTAAVLTTMLRDRGLTVVGEGTSGVAPGGAAALTSVTSPAVRDHIRQILRYSDNTASELQLKELGFRFKDEGSTAAGASAVAGVLDGRGLPTAGVSVIDGSGLDRANQVTCELLVTLLDEVGVGGVIDQGLAVGARVGTLRKTWTENRPQGRIRAKTGSLDGVRSLSGFMAGPEGEAITFAYLQNNYSTGYGATLRRNELGEILALHADARTLHGGVPGDQSTVPIMPGRITAEGCPADEVPEDGFADAADSVHEASIDCIVYWGVSNGTGDGRYQPRATVTRAQMATFIAQLITEAGGVLPDSPADAFDGDEGSVHHGNINRLAAAGIVSGVAPRRYNHADPVSRAQMATFLRRAYEFVSESTMPSTIDPFVDDNTGAGATHQAMINAIAQLGISAGVTPFHYEPSRDVTREQMATFIARVLDLLVEADAVPTPANRPEPEPDPGPGPGPGPGPTLPPV